MRPFSCLSLSVALWTLVAATGRTDEPAATDKAASPTYLLRYKFQPGDVMRWKVVHQAIVRTTVSGTTQTAETRSESIKVWQVKEMDAAAGQAKFVHSVESVDMRQSVSGRQDVRYNSVTDAVPPPEFEEVAKAVGVPLTVVTLSDRGLVIKRHEERASPSGQSAQLTVPLPENAVAVGETWSLPHDISVRQKDNSSKQVKTRQDFTLAEVGNGVATIRIETVVLTPVRDPALEAQLIQHISDGSVRFDIAAGRVIGQQTDVDKRVVGFQGEASSMHYVTRFTEDLMPSTAATASRPAAAKAAAAKANATVEEAPATVVAPVEVDAGPTLVETPAAAKVVTEEPSAPASQPAVKPAAKPAAKPATQPANRPGATTKPSGGKNKPAGGRPASTPQKRR